MALCKNAQKLSSYILRSRSLCLNFRKCSTYPIDDDTFGLTDDQKQVKLSQFAKIWVIMMSDVQVQIM